MPWVKKKGLYLPDDGSYAESVNAFSDGDFNELYISMGIYTNKYNATTLKAWPLLQKEAYVIQCYNYGTGYSGRENERLFRPYVYPVNTYAYSWSHPGGSWVMLEILSKTDGGTVWIDTLTNGLLRPGTSASGSVSDGEDKLKIGPTPTDTGIEIVITHLVIDNKLPPWVADLKADKYDKLMPDFFPTSPDNSSPIGVDLHWAMQEGLIDPSEFLHFYTFEYLDADGHVPDYGSNPQPLALYGNAQIVTAYEVEPQFGEVVETTHTVAVAHRVVEVQERRVFEIPRIFRPRRRTG